MNCDKIFNFISEIFPMGVRFLYCHCLRVVFTFFIDFEKFISGIRFKFVEKFIPKRVNSELSQSNFSVIGSFVFEFLFLPIQTIFVFSLLTFRPERLPNISSVFKADCSECRLPSRKRSYFEVLDTPQQPAPLRI